MAHLGKTALVFGVLLLGFSFALPVGAAAEDGLSAQDCAKLNNRAARLACFDQVFGRVPEPAIQEKVPAIQEKVPAIQEKEPAIQKKEPAIRTEQPEIQTEAERAAQDPAPTPEVSLETLPVKPANKVSSAETVGEGVVSDQAVEPEVEVDEPKGLGAIFGRKKTKAGISSRIKALRRRDRQRMVFLLENGEFWMQTSPRDLPIKEGDSVTIKSGMLGGHILRTENNVSTRVHQINEES